MRTKPDSASGNEADTLAALGGRTVGAVDEGGAFCSQSLWNTASSPSTTLGSSTRIPTSQRRPRLSYSGEFRSLTPNQSFGLDVTASGIDLIRFHGLGNATASDKGSTYYRVLQSLYRITPAWKLNVAPQATLALGATGQFASTREHARTFLGDTKPYGSDEFGQVGANLDLVLDRRNVPNHPTMGYRFAAGGALYPPLWSVESTFGEAHLEASSYVTVKGPLSPTLAMRVGARHLWGAFPFHNAAFLGGATTLRGWDEQRFAGRSAVSGSGEIRLHLGRVMLIVPSDVGVLGFVDMGRVTADGDASAVWHMGTGGGIWIAPLARNHTVSVSVASGKERTSFYLRSGFAF